VRALLANCLIEPTLEFFSLKLVSSSFPLGCGTWRATPSALPINNQFINYFASLRQVASPIHRVAIRSSVQLVFSRQVIYSGKPLPVFRHRLPIVPVIRVRAMVAPPIICAINSSWSLNFGIVFYLHKLMWGESIKELQRCH